MKYKVIDKVDVRQLKINDVFILHNCLHRVTGQHYEEGFTFAGRYFTFGDLAEKSRVPHGTLVDLTNLKLAFVER